jgi:hypothetical protein
MAATDIPAATTRQLQKTFHGSDPLYPGTALALLILHKQIADLPARPSFATGPAY